MTEKYDTIQNEINNESGKINRLIQEIGQSIVGQRDMIEKLLIGLFTGGHILLEGVPGLAKTLAIKTIAKTINTEFKRIQFTPDLLPADLLGTLIYNQKTSKFSIRKGPIFSNIILADEINRAPSKVQSALLECMQEKQVTLGKKTYALDNIFWVLATENPIEQEGTYPLPEAQVDRFMLKVKIGYPPIEEEKKIIQLVLGSEINETRTILHREDVLNFQNIIKKIYIDEKVLDYITHIVSATRSPKEYGLPSQWLNYGASPRASIYLALAGKGHAFLKGRAYVLPEDIKAIGKDVLRHRIIISYEAEAEEMTSDHIIDHIFQRVAVP